MKALRIFKDGFKDRRRRFDWKIFRDFTPPKFATRTVEKQKQLSLPIPPTAGELRHFVTPLDAPNIVANREV